MLSDLGGVWRTIGGRRIFIKDGEDLATAMKKSGKFGKKELKEENNLYKNEIQEKAKEQTWEEFKNNIKNKELIEKMKDQNIKSLKDMRKYWVEQKTKDFTENDIKKITKEKAIDIVKNNINNSTLDGWFKNADSSYKEKIETIVLENKELRNAGLNIAYNNYIENTNENISFKDFVNKEITMYRGERGQQTISKDVFKSFTTDKKIAEKFGNNISEMKIRPIDTLGSYQTTGENEYLVFIDKILKK